MRAESVVFALSIGFYQSLELFNLGDGATKSAHMRVRVGIFVAGLMQVGDTRQHSIDTSKLIETAYRRRKLPRLHHERSPVLMGSIDVSGMLRSDHPEIPAIDR